MDKPTGNSSHRRRSIRLEGFDYTLPGAYFITLVSSQRKELFGSVTNNDIQLTQLGKIVSQEWFRSAEMRREIQLFEDEFTVMPNHIHAIVWITGSVEVPSQPGSAVGVPHKFLQRASKSLPSLIAGYKSSVTARARRELGIAEVWQRNYFEHVIRDDADFLRILKYIQNNLQNWLLDDLHPS